MSHEYDKCPAAVDALNPADTNLTAVLFSKRDALANAARGGWPAIWWRRTQR